MTHLDPVFARLAQQRARRAEDPSAGKAKQLLARLLPQQRDVVEDPSKRKAVLCAGRAGKSYTFAVYILVVLLAVPRADVLFIAYIRSEAKEILWGLLKQLNDEFQLQLHFGEAELVVTNTRNGARARVAGCESWGDVDKFRGVPRHLVILDETATWPADLLENLIRDVIEPRLGDYKGTLLMGGTPGAVLAGMFYDATGDHASAVRMTDDGVKIASSRRYAERDDQRWVDVEWTWSLHGWSLEENTSERGKSAFAEALKLKRKNGWSDDNPTWMREYRGRWMADGTRLVFGSYDSARNDWEPGERSADNPFGLPAGHYFRFVICCDLGFHDPFSIQVGAFSDTYPDLLHVYEWEDTERIVKSVGAIAAEVEKVHALIDPDDIEAEAADLQGLGGTVVGELAEKYNIFLERLEQREKRDYVELANSGLHDGRIRVLKGSGLAREMSSLAWDRTGLKMRPNQPNNNADAFLGVVRHSRHLEAVAPVEKPKPGTPAFLMARESDEEERIAELELKRHRGRNSGLNDDQDFID